MHLGELDGQSTDRLARITALFDGCRLAVNLHTDMLPWLWTHFAIEAGVIGTAIKAGDPSRFLDSTDWLEQAVLAVRDALAVVKARGVEVTAILDAQPFFAPPEAVAAGIREQYRVDRAARKIMERHTAHDELQHIYFDVLATGRELRVEMPTLAALAPYVARARAVDVGPEGPRLIVGAGGDRPGRLRLDDRGDDLGQPLASGRVRGPRALQLDERLVAVVTRLFTGIGLRAAPFQQGPDLVGRGLGR